MVRDFARNQMPRNSVWDMVDWIPSTGAPLRGRGGWANAADISAVTGSATQIVAGIQAPFTAGTQNLCFDEDGGLYKFTGVNAVTAVTGYAGELQQNPVFHNNLVIIPSPDGTAAGKKYSGTAISALDASAPAAMFATVFKDYTCLANTAANPRRLYFSVAGDPAGVWDTTTSLVDFSNPVKGLASLKNTIMVFHDGVVSRLRGTVPPPDGDMIRDDPVFRVGLLDAHSIAVSQDQVFWCAAEGVFRTDGVALDDLTRRGGMRQYWQEILSTYDAATWSVVGGIAFDTYVVALMNGQTFVDGFLIDLQSQAWGRLSNLDARSMWSSITTFEELYFGRGEAAVVGSLSSVWAPAATVKTDGDGTPILPSLQTAFYEGPVGLKSYRRAYVGAQVVDYATDNPAMTVAVIRTPEATTYSSAVGTITEQSTYRRQHFPLNFTAPGIAYQLQRTGAGDTLLYSLEAELHTLEQSRLAA